MPFAFFLTDPHGLFVWLLLAFFITIYVLYRFAWKRIVGAIDEKQQEIVAEMDAAEKAESDAQALLEEYRQRLKAAEEQAEEIIRRAENAAEDHRKASEERANPAREDLLERTRKDVEAETRRAIQEIRNEVADLTIQATGIVTRKALSEEDQRNIVERELAELDFSALSKAAERN
jgi:F-type H+-transporting ATPase subunit b